MSKIGVQPFLIFRSQSVDQLVRRFIVKFLLKASWASLLEEIVKIGAVTLGIAPAFSDFFLFPQQGDTVAGTR